MRVGLILSLLVACLVADAEPCDCARRRSVTEEFKAADAVFVGTLDSATDLERKGPDAISIGFEVEASYKGLAQPLVMLSYRRTSLCQHAFEAGETYLVYAFRTTKGALHTHTCSRTVHIDEARDDLDELPEPTYLKEE